MWNLGLGIVAVLCLKSCSKGFFAATIIGTGVFFVGAGLGHLYELVVHGNTAANNAGAGMYLDIFYPFVLAALLVLYHIRRKEAGATGAAV